MVEAMAVDVQCIMPAIGQLAKKFHTKIITTTPKARWWTRRTSSMTSTMPWTSRRRVLKIAIDNFPNRKKELTSPVKLKQPNMVAGFSDEYIEYMQGGQYRGSYRPLNDAIISGRIRGVVGLAGCNNRGSARTAFITSCPASSSRTTCSWSRPAARPTRRPRPAT